MPASDCDTAIVLVKAAIERIKQSGAEFLAAETNPQTDRDTRDAARVAASAAIQAFAYQWQNVDLILREWDL